MKHQTTRALCDYWRRCRGGKRAPSRASIEPSEIHAHLGNSFILECDAPPRAPFRLAGTRVCTLFNRELKGTDYHDLWQPGDRKTLAAAIRVMREETACYLIGWRGRTARNYAVSGEAALLPLTMGGSEIVRILGAMVAFNPPDWIGALPLVDLQLHGIRKLAMDEARGGARVPPAAVAFAPAGAQIPRRKVGHLFVYDGGLTSD